ncbi:hypothetical protein Tco_0252764 [Tanacetum coccineum]
MDHDGVALCLRRRLHALRTIFLPGFGVGSSSPGVPKVSSTSFGSPKGSSYASNHDMQLALNPLRTIGLGHDVGLFGSSLCNESMHRREIHLDVAGTLRVILSEDDYDRGCREPSNLEDEFYRDTINLGLEYATGMDDEGEVT